jgi:hypothetical protein
MVPLYVYIKCFKNKKQDIVKIYTSPEFKYAVACKLFKFRNRSAALIKKKVTSTPKRAKKI